MREKKKALKSNAGFFSFCSAFHSIPLLYQVQKKKKKKKPRHYTFDACGKSLSTTETEGGGKGQIKTT